MTPEEREQMNSLCIRIQNEKDYERFEALLRELNDVISRKERRFPQSHSAGMPGRLRPWKTVSGVVQKVLKNIYSRHGADAVEISIAEAEELFREIRIENRFTDVDGQPVALKDGARLDVTFEADAKDTSRAAVPHAY